MAAQAQRFLSSRTRWLVFGLLLAVGTYLLAVTPVRTYLDQRHDQQMAEQRYGLLASANQRLNERVGQLQTDEEIQRLAREQYELVPPGAEAYAVMPPPPAPVQDDSQKKHNEGLWSRIWNKVPFVG